MHRADPVGFTDTDPIGCFFDEANLDPTSGSVAFTVTAPGTPGPTFLAFRRGAGLRMLFSGPGWWKWDAGRELDLEMIHGR